ncbi:hypothetical protein Tsubulata_043445 [Turnera subulata]|uniref:Uncharacterized protein n=1 Tax=Turnera subulata TaxID=218843 RepID=A0A9Q0FTI5_9ROSI|nr:hypothetical protein Tsubulata_043445 [Turnera subulata]
MLFQNYEMPLALRLAYRIYSIISILDPLKNTIPFSLAFLTYSYFMERMDPSKLTPIAPVTDAVSGAMAVLPQSTTTPPTMACSVFVPAKATSGTSSSSPVLPPLDPVSGAVAVLPKTTTTPPPLTCPVPVPATASSDETAISIQVEGSTGPTIPDALGLLSAKATTARDSSSPSKFDLQANTEDVVSKFIESWSKASRYKQSAAYLETTSSALACKSNLLGEELSRAVVAFADSNPTATMKMQLEKSKEVLAKQQTYLNNLRVSPGGDGILAARVRDFFNSTSGN